GLRSLPGIRRAGIGLRPWFHRSSYRGDGLGVWEPQQFNDGRHAAIIRKALEPAELAERHPVPEDTPKRWALFKRGLAGMWQRFWGYSWPQVDRLREAKLREFESGNAEREARARRLDAEAELMYAKAEGE